MRIGIDIREACVSEKAGKGMYTDFLVQELLKIDTSNDYHLFTQHAPPQNTFARGTVHLIGSSSFFWHFAALKKIIQLNLDLFFAPTSYIIPALLPKKFPSMITVHDCSVFLNIYQHETKASIIERIFARRALARAIKILTPSQSTKKDIMNLFQIPPEKINVTPLAASEIFSPKIIGASAISEKYILPKDFILAVGTIEPRKNYDRLIDAVVALKSKGVKLVIAGRPGWNSKNIIHHIGLAGDSVIHLTNCSDHELPALYTLAKFFVMPSLYEGFGIPILEAMASGCPVISSNAGSLPEVGGDAAIFFDPHDTEQIKAAIEKLWDSETLKRELREKGLVRAKHFHWRKTAEMTLAAIGDMV